MVNPSSREELLFEICESREELQQHIKTFLKIDLPDYIVDENSTSTAMDFVWEIYNLMRTGKGPQRHVVAASRNSAKCLAEGTLVATPKGPIEIQNLKPGDTVFDEFGKPVEVVALHNQGMQECVDLWNGRTKLATCTPNHVWLMNEVRKQDNYYEKQAGVVGKGWAIKRVELNLPLGDKHEPLAYALGALLGDGCSTECGVRISSQDDIIPNKVAKLLNTTLLKLRSNNYSYILHSPQQGKKWHFSDFYEKCIRNKRAHEKTADLDEIRTWDRESLLAFVAGVIDTDGSVYLLKNQIYIKIAMQAEGVIKAMRYAFMALWQVDMPIKSEWRHYKNGPMHMIELNSVYHCKRVLKELDPHLILKRKKYQLEYDSLKPNNFNPARVGFIREPAGLVHCWDITVDSPSSLYCLQNGLVTHNTLTACIIRFYSMIHFRRTGTHLAATMDQSQSAIGYLDKFLAIPEVHKYLATDNTRTKELKGLPPNSHTKNDTCKLRVSVATKKGVNSQRGSLNMRDETDLLPPAIISESVFIADPTQDEHRFGPIEIDLSSRKTNDGPMQQKIDEAEGKDPPPDLKLHKWSAVDWMRECPTEIHKPEMPRVKAWLNTDNLKVTWDEEIFKRLPKTEQTLNQEIDAYEGCKTCPAFVVCQARAPKQKSRSKMLRDIAFVSLILKGVNSAEAIIAQALNLKPESSSIVFKTFRRHRHFLKPHEFYRFITGVYWNPERMTEEEIEDGLDRDDLLTLIKITPSKDDIYQALVQLGWDINYGVDWGYNPASAVCIVGAYHRRQKRAVVLHVASSHEYANVDWAAYIAKNIWSQYPGDLVCPDMADPASPSYFGKHKMPCLDYKPSKIETGVSQLRSLLWNPGTQSEMFALLDDGDMGENWKLAEAFEKWTYKKTPVGFDYDKFEDNDFCDFCLAPGTLVITSKGTKKIEDIVEGDMVLTHKGRFRRVYATMNRQYNGVVHNVNLQDDSFITATPDHRVFCTDGWRAVGEMRQVDNVIMWDGSVMEQFGSFAAVYSGIVHNIAVEEDESYTANGVVVHNCDPTRYTFAPFIEESHISVLANQDRKTDLKAGILMGDKEAIAEYQRKQEFKSQFAEHMQSNFGVTDPFGTKVKDETGKDRPQKGGSIRFKF